MKKSLITLFFFALASFVAAQDQTTFILVRHAEKGDDGTRNPPLNEAGEARAVSLAGLLEKQEIAALYATPFKRTRGTLQPLAEKKEIDIRDYDPFAGGEWLSGLYEAHAGQTIVIAGHSNTIPALANALLGTETFAQFEEKEYSNLIIIVGNEVGKGTLVRLSF